MNWPFSEVYLKLSIIFNHGNGTHLKPRIRHYGSKLKRIRRSPGKWEVLFSRDQVKWSESHSVVSDYLWPHGLYSPWNSPGQNIGLGSLSFSPEDLPNPGIELRSPTLQADFFYQLSHQGSPRIQEWVAYSFSRVSFWPRNRTEVSSITGRFINWDIREAPEVKRCTHIRQFSTEESNNFHLFFK